EDFVEEDDSYEITTDPDVFSEVREGLEKEGVPMASAEVTMIPDTYVTLSDPDDIKNMNRILDLLEGDDDVQAVYHNWEEEDE
ncbi:MAG: YebC/PmpR family DNA-binding transcriptional regulator, partial [Eubacterium sp.]|nr:YebC/PmpR family DNA-binding transcriptional regulator [Eubacterium sp.]